MTNTRFKNLAIISYFGALPPLLRYGLAVLAVTVATIATRYMPVFGERAPFLLLFFAIIQSSFWFGWNSGLLAMTLSLIAANALILLPVWNSSPYDAFILNTGFCALSTIIIVTTSRHQNSILALRESRQRYIGMIESAMDAIITIDANQRIMLFNAAAEKMFACTADEAIGGAIERFIPERFRHSHSQHINTFGCTHSTSRKMGELGTIIGLRSNGEEFSIEASISQSKMDGEKLYTAILRDVTERECAELALKEQLRLQDQLAKVTATVPGAICSFRLRPDGSAHMPYASQVFESLHGLSLESVAKDFSPVFTRIHPDDISHVHETIAESAVTLQPWRDSFRYNHSVKGEVWLEGHSMPVRETDGSTLWHGFIQDITERKRAETALRKSEERMRLAAEEHLHELQVHQIELEMQNEELRRTQIALETSRAHYVELFDFAPVGYLTLTTEGFISEINLTSTKLLGAKPKDMIHKRFAKFIADEHKDRWYQFFQRTKQQNDKQSIRLPLRRKDGTSLFAHFDCQYEKAEDALPLLRIALTDITERTLTEAALRNAQARLALAVEAVQAGYWDWNLTTRTLYVSPEWKRQIGFDDSELVDGWEQKEERLHPDDQAMVKTATENFIAGRLPVYELQFRLRHKDGSYRWIHSRAALLRDTDNQPCRMLGINLDITDYMRSKELNEQREKMEQSFRLYVASQTAAAIAHELNQPLTAISYYTDAALLMLQTGNQNSEKFTHILENCTLQAQRAGEVIRQLTTLLHKGEINSEPIDINLTVQEALDYVKADVHLGTFKIEHDLAADLSPVSANHLQIQKVLITLLRNGLESMQESGINDGAITVTTRKFDSEPGIAQVTVCDSGKGVADAAILKNMFKPFHTTKASGLGMGLAISRALIEAHGGKIWAEQNADIGLSIHLTLPFVI